MNVTDYSNLNETYRVFLKETKTPNLYASTSQPQQAKPLPAEKEKTFNKKLVLLLSAATAGGILLVGAGISLMKPTLLKKIAADLDRKIHTLKEKVNPDFVDKLARDILVSAKKILNGAVNIVLNLNAAKDFYSEKALKNMDKKHGIITQLVDKSTDAMANLAIKSTKNKYLNLLKNVQKIKNYDIKSPKIMPILDEIETSIRQIQGSGLDLRCNETKQNLNAVAKDFFKEYVSIFSKTSTTQTTAEKLKTSSKAIAEMVTKSSESFISDDSAKALKKAMKKKFWEDNNALMSQLKALKKELEKPDSLESQKIKVTLKNLHKKVENTVKFETNNLFERLRDLALGSAPVEMLGIILPIPYISYKLIGASDKKERKKILLKEGVPLSFGMAGWAYGSMFRLFNAPTALAFSIVTGGIFAKIGNYLENKYESSNTTKIKEYRS